MEQGPNKKGESEMMRKQPETNPYIYIAKTTTNDDKQNVKGSRKSLAHQKEPNESLAVEKGEKGRKRKRRYRTGTVPHASSAFYSATRHMLACK
jgi:hypothetical protein